MKLLSLSLTLVSVAALGAPAAAQCQTQKVFPADSGNSDQFGATVWISGDRAVVGMPFDDDYGFWAGAAYIFERENGTWVQKQKLQPADLTIDDRLGVASSISGDYVLLGTRYDQEAGYGTGAAYVFERQASGLWVENGKLLASDKGQGDFFGNALAISGEVALVGAYQDDDFGLDSGAAYVYERQAGVWTQVVKLTASDAQTDDRFGYHVALSGDIAVIGAHADDDMGAEAGATYVFERQTNGQWLQTAKLFASDAGADDHFGRTVAIDGNTLLVAATYDSDLNAFAGSVYSFEKVNGLWIQTDKLTVPNPGFADLLGDSLALSGDTAILGSWAKDEVGPDSGLAYVFRRVGTDWIESGTVRAEDEEPKDAFGIGVSIDGNTVIVGARGDDLLGFDSGSAYFFDVSLCATPVEISLSTGGQQTLVMDLGQSFAGDPYFVVGSASGTSPGFSFGSFLVPLNFDSYFLFTLNNANQAPLGNTFGLFDAAGHAAATVTVPVASDPALVGVTLQHAYGAIDLTLLDLAFVSRATPLVLIP